MIANREVSIRKFIRKLGSPEHLRPAMKPGPTGFVLYWATDAVGGVKCDVWRRRWFRKKPGDRVKDRPAGCSEAAPQSPLRRSDCGCADEGSEALRDLVRRERRPSRISCEQSIG